jgi:hypothetical protein
MAATARSLGLASTPVNALHAFSWLKRLPRLFPAWPKGRPATLVSSAVGRNGSAAKGAWLAHAGGVDLTCQTWRTTEVRARASTHEGAAPKHR